MPKRDHERTAPRQWQRESTFLDKQISKTNRSKYEKAPAQTVMSGRVPVRA